MITQALTLGPMATNCYIVFLEKSKRLYIIDPGYDGERIVGEVRRFPAYDWAEILLSHAHVDHISAAGYVAEKLNLDGLMMGADDAGIYFSPENEILPYMPPAEDLPQPYEIETEGFFTALHTPGHSPGGYSYLFEEDGQSALFVGDTLFAGSVGRSDLWGGSHEVLINSIREKLLVLPRLTAVFPGHGAQTTIGKELVSNPYLQ